MPMRKSYPALFVPLLAVALLLLVGAFVVFTGQHLAGTARSTQSAAGVAQIVGAATPEEQYAAVTSETRRLEPSEQARAQPQGQPDNLPEGSPHLAGEGFPDSRPPATAQP